MPPWNRNRKISRTVGDAPARPAPVYHFCLDTRLGAYIIVDLCLRAIGVIPAARVLEYYRKGPHFPPLWCNFFIPPECLARRSVAFCGIARPDAFRITVHNLLGAGVELLPFPDHHYFTPDDLESIRICADSLPAPSLQPSGPQFRYLVTTEKDFFRCPSSVLSLAEGGTLPCVVLSRFEFIAGGDRVLSLVDKAVANPRGHGNPPRNILRP